MSFFEKVPLAVADPIFGLNNAFKKDERPTKINLSIGVYKTDDLVTAIFPTVKLAEALLLEEEKTKEYLPIEGDPQFIDCMGALVFGYSMWEKNRERIVGCQSVGGTGALRIGGTLLKEEAEGKLFISQPTWPNHRAVFLASGLHVEEYPYYDMNSHAFDFVKMEAFLQTIPSGSIVVLHTSSHNPTGLDPSELQWRELCKLFQSKKLIPFFDFAYQGLGRGVDADAFPIRLFLEAGVEMLIAVSSSKNFSLYAERVGCFFAVAENKKIAEHILSRVKQIVRWNYSNPPMHGAKVVARVLSNPSLRQSWTLEVDGARGRIIEMRDAFYKKLCSNQIPIDFSHIQKTVGMFIFSGLSKPQVEKLIAQFGIYMTYDGRMNVCGLTKQNIDSIVSAIIKVCQ